MKHLVVFVALVLGLGLAGASPASAQRVDIRWTEIVPPFTRTTDQYWARFVSFDGQYIVIGGPGRVDVFRWDGTTAVFDTTLVATSGDSAGFGNEGFHVDAGRIVVQARDVAPRPALFVFTRGSGGWAQVARFTNPVASDVGDQFFGAYAMDGPRLLIGTPYANTARGYASVIHADGAGAFAWTLGNESRVNGTTNYELLGASVHVVGDRVAVGTLRAPGGGYPQTGRATLYRDTGSALSPIIAVDNPTPSTDEQFGSAVAVLPDGFIATSRYDDTATTDAGVLYVFDDTGAIRQTIYGPAVGVRPMFGNSVHLDGSWMLVGAPTYLGSGIGSMYLYRRDASGMFRERARIMPADVGTGPNLGGAQALRGRVIVAGVQSETVSGATNAGRAWVGVVTEPDGGACSADPECTNGHCVGGICCNTACSGACDVCGTGTCVVTTCDAGTAPDASVPLDAFAEPDAFVVADAYVPIGVDASFPDAVVIAPDAYVPPGVDAGPIDASSAMTPDAASTDTVPRTPLSCTCRVGARSEGHGALAWLAVIAMALVARRRRR